MRTRRTNFMVLFLLLLIPSLGIRAQERKEKVSMECVDQKLTDALKQIEKQSDYKIIFTYNELQNVKVTVKIENLPAPDAVRKLIEKERELKSTVDGRFIHVFRNKKQGNDRAVTGLITDHNRVPLPGVTVVNKKNRQQGTTTDVDGNFRYPLNRDEQVTLVFSFIGKKSVERTLKAGETVKLMLEDDYSEIEEVVVTGW